MRRWANGWCPKNSPFRSLETLQYAFRSSLVVTLPLTHCASWIALGRLIIYSLYTFHCLHRFCFAIIYVTVLSLKEVAAGRPWACTVKGRPKETLWGSCDMTWTVLGTFYSVFAVCHTLVLWSRPHCAEITTTPLAGPTKCIACSLTFSDLSWMAMDTPCHVHKDQMTREPHKEAVGMNNVIQNCCRETNIPQYLSSSNDRQLVRWSRAKYWSGNAAYHDGSTGRIAKVGGRREKN